MSKNSIEIQYALDSLTMEIWVVELFSNLAKRIKNEERSQTLQHFVEEEKGHCDFWLKFLKKRNIETKHIGYSNLKLQLYLLLARIFGFGLVYKLMERNERVAIKRFSEMLTFDNITDIEKKGIQNLLEDELKHEEQFEEYEKLYKFYINRVQTILTQLSGGLVSVLSISIGVTGVSQDPIAVGITGLIVGLSSSVNTFTLFYFLARTQRYVKEKILGRVKVAVNIAPDVYAERVSGYMIENGFSAETSSRIADEAKRDPSIMERIIADEEYGIKPEALGDPYGTAFYSSIFRVFGSIIPLTPYFLGVPVMSAIPLSVVLTLLMLAVVGVLVALFAEIDVKEKVIDLTMSGFLLATLTFIISKLAVQLKTSLL